VDRIWSAWQARWPQSAYVPPADAPDELAFHRLRDALYTFFDETVTPEDMLQHDKFYTYDSIADLS
jgi:hypothetical protein